VRRQIVPISEREENEVDRLLRQNKGIRDSCKHDFRLLEKPNLKKSKVTDVFVVYDAESSFLVKGTSRCL
jgi:hypothetical protein